MSMNFSCWVDNLFVTLRKARMRKSKSFDDFYACCSSLEMTSVNIEIIFRPSKLTDLYLLIEIAAMIPHRFLDIEYHQFTTG